MRTLTSDELKALEGFIAWAQREDGDPSANDPTKYVVYAEHAGRATIVWGPGGVIVWDEPNGQYAWADDLDDMEMYYTDEYEEMFP